MDIEKILPSGIETTGQANATPNSQVKQIIPLRVVKRIIFKRINIHGIDPGHTAQWAWPQVGADEDHCRTFQEKIINHCRLRRSPAPVQGGQP